MSKRAAKRNSKLQRLRALPWVTLAQGGIVLSRRWRALSGKERTRLKQLVRASRGRPANLSTKERVELRRLVGKLDPKAIARELVPLVRPRRGWRRRARGRK